MDRRAWFRVFALSVTSGCATLPEQAKDDSASSKTPRLALGFGGKPKNKEVQKEIQQVAAVKEVDENLYRVRFETTVGDFVVEVHRDWAPLGAERFHELVETGFFDGCKFFRVLPDFMVQFGINGDPEVSRKWRDAKIEDDVVHRSNRKGFITFATSGPNSRTTQVFINYKANVQLNDQGFAPFGQVVEGMDIVEKINSQYGERPDQPMIQRKGNAYLEKDFPKLDGIIRATFVTD